MKQFHVYQVNPGQYKAIGTSGCNSVEDLEIKFPELKDVNWYGLLANNPEDAIEQAKQKQLDMFLRAKFKILKMFVPPC